MRPALRNTTGMLLAFVVASAIMMIVESVNGKVLYPALGKAAEGMTDKEAIRQIMASAPIGALLVVLGGWALGTLAGAFVVARIAAREIGRQVMIFGWIIAFAGIMNNLMLPPPAWFWVAGVVVPLAVAFLVARSVSGWPAAPPREG